MLQRRSIHPLNYFRSSGETNVSIKNWQRAQNSSPANRIRRQNQPRNAVASKHSSTDNDLSSCNYRDARQESQTNKKESKKKKVRVRSNRENKSGSETKKTKIENIVNAETAEDVEEGDWPHSFPAFTAVYASGATVLSAVALRSQL